MKSLRFSLLAVILMVVALSSCFESGDNVFPAPQVVATERMLIGKWTAYEMSSTSIDRGAFRELYNAGVEINPGSALTIIRKNVPYTGLWTLSEDGGYVSFTLDVNDGSVMTAFPDKWSIQRLDEHEFWVATSVKQIRMRRTSALSTK